MQLCPVKKYPVEYIKTLETFSFKGFLQARDGARRPGDVGFARTEAKQRHSNVRGTAVPRI